MNISTLPDSDSSDEDYVPHKKAEDNLSEEDSDEELDDDILSNKQNNVGTRKRTKSSLKCRKKQNINDYTSEDAESKPLTIKNEKKVEDVWADFIKDTGFQTKESRSESCDKSNKTNSLKSVDDGKLEAKKKVLVTEVVNFAGEDITVEKTLLQGTSEDKLLKELPISRGLTNTAKSTPRGVGGILSQLIRKPKINTLEKSKLDWDKFKKEEKLEEELQTYNKGKAGYLERQDFLQRADLRRFEIEKEIRTIERNKRVT